MCWEHHWPNCPREIESDRSEGRGQGTRPGTWVVDFSQAIGSNNGEIGKEEIRKTSFDTYELSQKSESGFEPQFTGTDTYQE
jgi:hypothetical protein